MRCAAKQNARDERQQPFDFRLLPHERDSMWLLHLVASALIEGSLFATLPPSSQPADRNLHPDCVNA